MDVVKIQKLAWSFLGERQSHPNREPGYTFYHGQRVAKIALQLRELIYPNQSSADEVIMVASWFHDLAKGIEPHWHYGALIAGEILQDYCDEEDLLKIQEIIRNHTLRKEQEYPFYVRLVQDADTLDHYGSQEIWLNFLHTAHARQNIDYVLEFYQADYQEHAHKSRCLLNYQLAVDYFDEKDRFVRDFVERFAKEGRGGLVEIRKD